MTFISRFLLSGAIFLYFHVLGQSKYLKPGAPLPNISFPNVLNYKSRSLNFTDFKSKFVILDFWNTACISCIKSFPLIDSLQKEYSDKIQFVLANRESLDSTIRFFKRRKNIKMPNVPMITDAKDLSDMFAIDAFPYTVWIDDLGRVKYFIDTYNLNKQNLNNLTSGKDVLAQKMDRPIFRGNYFDPGRPDSLKSNLLYYCYISRYSDAIDIGNSERGQINDSAIRIANFGLSIVDLYKMAYREYDKYNFDRPESIVLLIKDSAKYIAPTPAFERETWFPNYGYSFDMMLPLAKKDSAYKIMQQQLCIYFGLQARVIKQYKNGELLDVLEIKE